MQSLARLILRLLAYILVTAGLISTDAAAFLVDDPDVLVVTTTVVGGIAIEVGLGVRKMCAWYRRRKDVIHEISE